MKEIMSANNAPKIKGWVARDKDGILVFFLSMPHRDGTMWIGSRKNEIVIDRKSFPDLKWKDEPIEVELIINRV